MCSTLYIGSTSLGFRFLIPRDSYPFTLFLTSSSKFSLLRHRFPQRCLTPQGGPSLRNKVKRHMHRGLALHSRASFNWTWTPFGVVQPSQVKIWNGPSKILPDHHGPDQDKHIRPSWALSPGTRLFYPGSQHDFPRKVL